MPTTHLGLGRTVTPYLIVADAAKALAWYADVLGMEEVIRLADRDGKVMHAEGRFGESSIMIADEFPDMGYRSPTSLGASPVSILLYVGDVDAVCRQAIDAGAEELAPASDQFDGDRRATLRDPFGHVWLLATKKETISHEEMRRRFDQMMANQG